MYKTILSITLLILIGQSSIGQFQLDSISDGSGYTYIASPLGTGPFPAVLYNHGGLDTAVGGDLRGTSVALAHAGYFVRAEKRMETASITGHLSEVETALDDLRADPRADTNCVSIIGFSRGGLLTLQAAEANPFKVNAIISMAPANPIGQLDNLLTDLSAIDDPVLVLVAANDTFQDQHVYLAQITYDSLINAGKTAFIQVYPGYDSNGDMTVDASDDGHELFFSVQSPYWSDVLNFLSNLCNIGDADQIPAKVLPTVRIAPNPFIEYTRITFLSKEPETYSLLVYNMNGSLIQKHRHCKGKHAIIKRSDLKSGIYVLQIITDNETYPTVKLVIE